MDQGLTVVLWIASGAFIGGVVTPLVSENKQFSGWLSMAAGLVAGAAGNVIFLVPLWLLLSQILPDDARTMRPAWQWDAITLAEAQAGAQQPALPSPQEATARLRALLWPAPRAAGHSHRAAYIQVFVALALLTAIEVLLTVVDFGVSMTGPLVMLSTIKVLLVVLFFMHLRYDSRWYAGFFVYAVPFAALIIIVLALAV
jgi:cytochrome c oxidase subunit 4